MMKINRRKYKLVMRFVLFLAVFMIVIQICSYKVYAVDSNQAPENDQQTILDEQLQSKEVNSIENSLNKQSDKEADEILSNYNPEDIIKDVSKGSFKLDIVGILNRGIQYLLKEVYRNIDILIKLTVLVVFCAILKNLQASFLSENVGELAFYACYVVIVSVVVVSLNTALSLGTGIIDNMVDFMHATIPVLITLLVSGGNVASGSAFQPILIMIVEIAATIFKNALLPLVFLSTVLSIVDNISDKIQISKLAAFLKQICVWGIGLILSIFIGVIAIQGSVGAVVDGVTSKTAKFAIGAMIPVAGKYLADAADTVIGCTLLIKNAAGIAAMVGIIAICVVPLLKIAALIVLYRLTAMFIEPISEKRITKCISDIANSLTLILGVAASVAFMFLIAITAIITASSVSAAVR